MRFFLGCLIFLVWASFCSWWYVCKIKEHCHNCEEECQVHAEQVDGHNHEGHDHEGHDHEGHDHEGHDHEGHDHGDNDGSNSLALSVSTPQGEQISHEGKGLVSGEKQNNLSTLNLQENHEGFLNQLAQYLKENPNQTLRIGSKYAGAESHSEDFGNMGLERGETMKRELVKRGVESENVVVNPIELEGLHSGDPQSLFALSLVESSKMMESIEAGSETALTKSIQFPPSSAEIIMDAKTRKLFQDLKAYADRNSNGHITIIGHTDTEGSETTNLQLGQKRAVAVLNELENLGISRRMMTAKSLGEKQPLADDGSDDLAKAKNRRVEFVLR